MKVKDELLAAYMNEKLHKVPTTLAKLKQVMYQDIDEKMVPDFIAFLKKKVPLK
jgi:hypothetical protein